MNSLNILVILEEDDFVVLNKPAGMLVHSPKGFDSSEATVADFVLKRYPEVSSVGDKPDERPGIVHRLDKDTSGVLIVARTNEFFYFLKNLFQTRVVQKTYLALVIGRLPLEGVIDIPIGLKPGTTRRSTRAKNMKMVKEARTEYKLIRRFETTDGEYSFIRVFPKTGRTHQIRVHFLDIHHPIVGDGMYGKRANPWNLKRQFLHAESIEFPLKNGKIFKVEADLPEDLKNIIEELEKRRVALSKS